MVEAKAVSKKFGVEAPRPTVDKRHRASPRPSRAFAACHPGRVRSTEDDRRVVDVAGCVAGLDAVDELIGRRFVREEPRARAGVYVRGLLAGLERKNGWTLAEHAGAVSPDGMQRLLRTADWDVDGVRDDVRGYVLDGLGDPGDPTAGVFVADDTGFV